MSSSTRATMPKNRREECSRCGQGIPYHGRRDLIAFVRSVRAQLVDAFRSSAHLADIAVGLDQQAHAIEAAVQGLCVSCSNVREVLLEEAAPTPSRQLNLIPE